MAWERRGHTLYYYRSKKEKGRVIREYLGRGARAVKAATEDAARHAVHNQERREQHACEALESQIAALDALTTSLSQALLVDAGFYKHRRGTWRKRRNNGTHITDLS